MSVYFLFAFIKGVFCFTIGAIFGNIFTTFFFRIPKNIPLNGITNPPMCSFCGVKLKYPYYGPFFHVLLKGFKTSCCGNNIPKIYTVIEFFIAIFTFYYFLFLSFTSQNLLQYFIIIVMLLNILLYYTSGKLYEKLNWILVILGIIYTAYQMPMFQDFTIFLFTEKIFYGAIATWVFFIINKIIKSKMQIEEACFYIFAPMFYHIYIFGVAYALSILLFVVLKRKRGIFLMPFLLLLLVNLF